MHTYRPDLLNALANYLEELPKIAFDLRHFIGKKHAIFEVDDKMASVLSTNPDLQEIQGCGATACALGHGPSVPELAAAGLKLEISKLRNNFRRRINVTYNNNVGYDAAEELFGIPFALVNHFFDPNYYYEEDLGNPKVVAERIHQFISNPIEYVEKNRLMHWC